MTTAEETNRFAPPTAHVEDVAAESGELAGRGARLGAVIIDGILQLIVVFALGYTVFPAIRPGNYAGGFASALSIQLVAGFVIFLALQGYLLVTRGQTIGKRLLGLRIVRTDGGRVTPLRMLGGRYFIGWLLAVVPFIGGLYAVIDALMIFRTSRKCLHDSIADTIVVKA